jgi:hypothetical protein
MAQPLKVVGQVKLTGPVKVPPVIGIAAAAKSKADLTALGVAATVVEVLLVAEQS